MLCQHCAAAIPQRGYGWRRPVGSSSCRSRLCPELPRPYRTGGTHRPLVAATQLKPDVGTPELPAGRVRVRREADGSVTEVDEDSVQRVSPLFGFGRRGVGSPALTACCLAVPGQD